MKTRAIRIVDFLKRAFVRVLIFVVVLAIAGVIYQTAATESDQRNYPPPGVLVNVGGYKMHIYCMGEGSPTVILDSANMGTVSNWAWIQPELAKSTRVCTYDRADSGWSDLSPQPNDTKQNAQALHTLLTNANVPGPYILVGHSFGGLYVRMFAEIYPDEVAGIVFIEGTLPDGLQALGKPDVMPNAPAAEMMDGTPFISRLGILRLVGFPGTDPDLPEPQRSELQAYLSSTRLAESLKRQYHLFPTLLAQVRPLYEASSLGNIPVAVVLGSEGDGGIPEWRDLFAAQAALSTNNIMVTVDGANHVSLVDRQEHALQTSAVIRKVIEAARSGQPLQ
jgi:pimeloyl-ACP methyl ester carboxylesterase